MQQHKATFVALKSQQLWCIDELVGSFANVKEFSPLLPCLWQNIEEYFASCFCCFNLECVSLIDWWQMKKIAPPSAMEAAPRRKSSSTNRCPFVLFHIPLQAERSTPLREIYLIECQCLKRVFYSESSILLECYNSLFIFQREVVLFISTQ